MEKVTRCGWVNLKNPIYVEYHDKEWGVPLHNDQKLFELLCLEAAQAGLSWEIILNKREEYKKCFWNFDVNLILKKSDQQLLERMQKFAVVKNRLKVLGVKKNAAAYKKIVRQYGSLSEYIWSFVNDKPIVNQWDTFRNIPAQTEISSRLSKELKKYGFTFVGPIICYAFMQACGMVSDHEKNCFKVTKILQ